VAVVTAKVNTNTLDGRSMRLRVNLC
jgi:hypothetical protein